VKLSKTGNEDGLAGHGLCCECKWQQGMRGSALIRNECQPTRGRGAMGARSVGTAVRARNKHQSGTHAQHTHTHEAEGTNELLHSLVSNLLSRILFRTPRQLLVFKHSRLSVNQKDLLSCTPTTDRPTPRSEGYLFNTLPAQR
jgi:hypothetical protein